MKAFLVRMRMKPMALEQRVSRLEGAYEQVDRRLDGMDRWLDQITRTLEALRAEMNSRFNNLYILFTASWVTIMGALIGLYIRG